MVVKSGSFWKSYEVGVQKVVERSDLGRCVPGIPEILHVVFGRTNQGSVKVRDEVTEHEDSQGSVEQNRPAEQPNTLRDAPIFLTPHNRLDRRPQPVGQERETISKTLCDKGCFCPAYVCPRNPSLNKSTQCECLNGGWRTDSLRYRPSA